MTNKPSPVDRLAKEIWDRFLMKLAIDIWGEKTVIAEKKQVYNLLGSVEKHQKFFDAAFREIMADRVEIMEQSKAITPPRT